MYSDRAHAGRLLAEVLVHRLGDPECPLWASGGLVLGLPRGGVPVASVVADALSLPLDVLVVRKIGVPWQPELALGAVGQGCEVVLNDDVVTTSGVELGELNALIRKVCHEVQEMAAELRSESGRRDVTGRMVVVVDDGVATGATARAAATVLRRCRSGPLVLATPVATSSANASLRSCFDEVICVETPSRFGSVGQHYEQFEQVSTAEVRRLLERSLA